MERLTRRQLIKAVIPGSWIPAAMSGLDRRYWSKASKISAVKDAFLLGGGILLLSHETPTEKLRERIQSFTWKDSENPEKLKTFVGELADGYLDMTQTLRVRKEDLVRKTSFYSDKSSFTKALREVFQEFISTPTQWGAADYKSGKVFIDLGTLKELAEPLRHQAGEALLDALWHEWGHVDVRERQTGELINNPRFGFKSPVSGKDELYKRYRAGEVYSDTYFGFKRFEEVWNEAITLKRMLALGFQNPFFANNYYLNGLDTLMPLTDKLKIPLPTIYEMHATSDFEGFAKLIGANLPGSDSPLVKGWRLFVAIHEGNREKLHHTGVYKIA